MCNIINVCVILMIMCINDSNIINIIINIIINENDINV